jgi:hypothetical protein
MSLGMFPLLCVTEAIPIPQAQHHPAVLPSTPHRRRELDDGGGEDGACRRARARVAQHSGSMPLQRALMDTLNASRAHQYATGLGALFLQASPPPSCSNAWFAWGLQAAGGGRTTLRAKPGCP